VGEREGEGKEHEISTAFLPNERERERERESIDFLSSFSKRM
jgi:hypothetical protein